MSAVGAFIEIVHPVSNNCTRNYGLTIMMRIGFLQIMMTPMTKVYQVVVTYGRAAGWSEVEVEEAVLITTLNAFEANRVWAEWNDNPEKRIYSHGVMRNARIKTFILDEYVEPKHMPKTGDWFG